MFVDITNPLMSGRIMSSATSYDAIKARLVDQLGGTYSILDWEQLEFALQQGTDPFIACEGSPGEARLTSIGTPSQNWVEDDGFFDVHIFVPFNGGLGSARTIADMVKTATQFYHFTAPAGETLRSKAVAAPAPGVIHNGLWHSMIVTIDFVHRYATATAA